MLESLWRDIAFARRNLARAPILVAVAMLSIALGVAATTSVFTIVDAALLRPPPFDHADRLAILYITRSRPGAPAAKERWSWTRLGLLRQRTSSFQQVGAFSLAAVTLTSGEPEPLNGEIVSSSYWPTLRVHPIVGRAFTADEDDGAAAHPVVMISNDLWQRRFGGDSGLLGRTIGINGHALTLVGILPPGFAGVSGQAQVWLPATMAPVLTYAGYLTTNQNFISAVGRLRDGVTLNRANAELALTGEAIQRAAPSSAADTATRFAATAIALSEARVDRSTRRPIWLLFGASGCLLMLACANVAGLLLGQALSRRREIAIRVATGATRGRIVRQLLIEAALLATGGGALGVIVAVPLANRLGLPDSIRNGASVVGEFAAPSIDGRVLAFSVLLCALTTLAFGLVPALRATRVDLTRDLKDGARGTGGSGGHERGAARQFIVGIEVALAVVLLFGGGLLAVSWHDAHGADFGFDRSHLLTFMIRPSDVEYPPAKAPALIDRVLAEVGRVPGVEAATVDACAPAGVGCAGSTLYVVGRPAPLADDAPPVLRHYIGPDQFRTLGVRLIRGRVFNGADRAGSNRVAIINEEAARRFWPHDDPIGQRVWFGGGSSFDRPDSSAEIVGIVGDVAYQSWDDHPFQADFYTPYAQFTYAARMVLVRTRGEPASVIDAMRGAVRAADANLTLFDVRSVEDRLGASMARLTYQVRLLAAFALIALLLAAAGVFAVIAHAIGARRSEIGVRVALGASPLQVLTTVGRQGARPAMVGAIVGVLLAALAGRVMASLLHGVRAFDAALLVAVFGVVAAVTLLTTYLAGRKALTFEPVDALRE
jgi:predicted permease